MLTWLIFCVICNKKMDLSDLFRVAEKLSQYTHAQKYDSWDINTTVKKTCPFLAGQSK